MSCTQNPTQVDKSIQNKDNFYHTNVEDDYCNINVGDCVSYKSCKEYLKKCNDPNNPYYIFNKKKLENYDDCSDESFEESKKINTIESWTKFIDKCNNYENDNYVRSQIELKEIHIKKLLYPDEDEKVYNDKESSKRIDKNPKNQNINPVIDEVISQNKEIIEVINDNDELPETIVIPTSILGDVSETRKQILQNTLEGELKNYFKIISQERFEEVQEKVFEELEYEECTEDQCIVMIQDILQVENVFHLQIIGEEGDTQLSLSWRNLDEKKRENEFCEGCKTKQLNNKIKQMVGKFVKQI